MKKHVVIISFAIFCTITGFIPSSKEHIEISECHYGQCHAKTKSTGNRCKHCVSKPGDTYCWQHE